MRLPQHLASVAPPQKPVPGAPEKQQAEVAIAGSMRGRNGEGQLQIGKDRRVELQIPTSLPAELTKPSRG